MRASLQVFLGTPSHVGSSFTICFSIKCCSVGGLSHGSGVLQSGDCSPTPLVWYTQTEKINLFPDRTTGYSKGCGFVIYRRQEDAQNLMTNSGGEMALPVTTIISWAANGC